MAVSSKLIFLLPPLPSSLSHSTLHIAARVVHKKFSCHCIHVMYRFKAFSGFPISPKIPWHLIFGVLLPAELYKLWPWLPLWPCFLSFFVTPWQPCWPPCYYTNIPGQYSPTPSPSYLLFPLRVLFQILAWLASLVPWSLCSTFTSSEKCRLITSTFTPHSVHFILLFASSWHLAPPDSISFGLSAPTRMKASGEQEVSCVYCCVSSSENSACHTISTQ